MAAASSTAKGTSRVASHAGSWYEADASKLTRQFDTWIQQSGPLAIDPATTRVHAIISPHAGYSYSGPTAAYGFKHMLPDDIRRVFILGPSHHHYTKICELSRHTQYATPVTPLKLDTAVIAELRAKETFGEMTTKVDEDEHSIEMQLPFLAHMMAGAKHPFTVVPILVGSLNVERERVFGALLEPYLSDPQNFFIISSDFCHWGARFRYQYTEKGVPIHEAIERLDRAGMALIEQQDADAFSEYLEEHQNTICGRHPIGVLLRMLEAAAESQPNAQSKYTVQFLHYAQSSRCKRMDDSSVSYATAIVTAPRK